MISKNITEKANNAFASIWNPSAYISDKDFTQNMNLLENYAANIVYAKVDLIGTVQLKTMKLKSEKQEMIPRDQIQYKLQKMYEKAEHDRPVWVCAERCEIKNIKYDIWTNKNANNINVFAKRLFKTVHNKRGTFIVFRRSSFDEYLTSYESITHEELKDIFRAYSLTSELQQPLVDWLSKPSRATRQTSAKKQPPQSPEPESVEQGSISIRSSSNDKPFYTLQSDDNNNNEIGVENGIIYVSHTLEKEVTETLKEMCPTVIKNENSKRIEAQETGRRRSNRKIKRKKMWE